jgi:hypothetical protein
MLNSASQPSENPDVKPLENCSQPRGRAGGTAGAGGVVALVFPAALILVAINRLWVELTLDVELLRERRERRHRRER